MSKRIRAVLIITAFAAVLSGFAETVEKSMIFLPGTQPEEGGIEFARISQCYMCHSRTNNGEADPFFSWSGGMMSQSARDPVYLAALTIANQDIPGVGEYCIRCHAPRGWLEGRSSAPDQSSLNAEDRHGISCDFCHRLVDPMSEEAKSLVEFLPPGFGNGMMVADTANVVRGPYDDSTGAMPHQTIKSDFHASSQLCAVCHNVSNPLLAEDVTRQPPHAYGHIERTYSEWALSDFAKRGPEGTCQACHYPKVEGGGQASRFEDRHRDHFVMHGPVGGSTWVQRVTVMLTNDSKVNPKALEEGKKRALQLLRTAASLELSFSTQGEAVLRITNLTGHKLPTGYPEGRRMWINVRYLNEQGITIDEIGVYGEKQDTLSGNPVTVSTLLDENRTRVYENLPGMSEEMATRHGKQPGKSFHFVLNDVITKDNRIPPMGFDNAAFAEHLCAPVGAKYEDGQHWDDIVLTLPDGAKSIAARLMYQSVSWEYIKFLAEENRTDDRGKRLYEAWAKTGQCPPQVIAELTETIGTTQ